MHAAFFPGIRRKCLSRDAVVFRDSNQRRWTRQGKHDEQEECHGKRRPKPRQQRRLRRRRPLSEEAGTDDCSARDCDGRATWACAGLQMPALIGARRDARRDTAEAGCATPTAANEMRCRLWRKKPHAASLGNKDLSQMDLSLLSCLRLWSSGCVGLWRISTDRISL